MDTLSSEPQLYIINKLHVAVVVAVVVVVVVTCSELSLVQRS